MCVDFTDRNKACPKDHYYPPSIDTNAVLVKKPNEKQKMCVDFRIATRHVPKIITLPYPLISQLTLPQEMWQFPSFILFQNTVKFSWSSRMPRRQPSLQIREFFYYKVMLFGVKNVGVIYQRLMNNVFKDLIGKNRSLCR